MTARCVVTCDTCPWTGTYTSEARAAYAAKRHSCERHLRLAELAERGRARIADVDRTPKPCLHKRACHQHGTYVTYTVDGCRCLPCAAAASEYERQRVRRIAYGRQTLVNAEPVRAHVRALMAQGMGFKRIGEQAGVSVSAVGDLLYGKRDEPTKRVRPHIARALLAVRLDLAGHAFTPAAGTWRRLEALQAVGWSKAALARELGHKTGTLQFRRDLVHVATAREVKALYDRLWSIDGGSSRARNLAAREGWPPPLWWDDEQIDDPAFVPDYQPYRPKTPQEIHAERAEEVAHLSAQGLSSAEIADRLGIASRTVVRLRAEAIEQVAA